MHDQSTATPAQLAEAIVAMAGRLVTAEAEVQRALHSVPIDHRDYERSTDSRDRRTLALHRLVYALERRAAR